MSKDNVEKFGHEEERKQELKNKWEVIQGQYFEYFVAIFFFNKTLFL